MKKIAVWTLAAALLISMLTGCQSSTPSSGAVSSKASSTSSASASAAATNRLEKIKAAGKIVMATSPDFAPYEFQDLSKTGQDAIVGSDIELGKYIAQQLGVKLVIESMDFGAIITAIQQGKVDMAISGLAYKPERAEAMELSSPYNIVGGYQGLLVLKENASKYTKLSDFDGKTIAAQNGSLQYDLTTQQIKTPKMEIISSLNDGIMMLQTKKIDAFAMSGVTGEQFCKNYDILAMSTVKFDYTSKGTLVGMPKGEKELLAAVNKIVEEAESSGKYSQWRTDATALSDKIGKK